jgi:hypothetical protein
MVVHLDLNAPFVPQAVINLVMKNLAGVALYLFQRQAARVSADPSCEHAVRIQSNRLFYRDWLLPKIRSLCASMDWTQPTISSLGDEGIPIPAAS